MSIGLNVKVPVSVLCQLYETSICWRDFGKVPNIKFHENSSMAADMFHADVRTRHDETNSRF